MREGVPPCEYYEVGDEIILHNDGIKVSKTTANSDSNPKNLGRYVILPWPV